MSAVWLYLFLLLAGVLCQKSCPPQEIILPCRCLNKRSDLQIWCSHSDLPKVLEGLRAIGGLIPDPIDELILENNYLPSLPGRAFTPLKVLRLMLRNNGLERVSSDWLVGLEKSLMELFIVEPDLRSLPEDSLFQLDNIEAITIQSNLMKRYPVFTGLPKLKYLQLESLSLLELTPRNFKNLISLETVHVSNSPRLTRLEANLIQDLPRLSVVNISYCGINWMHLRSITHLPKLKELSLVGNKITDVGMIGRSIRDLPKLEILRLDDNYIDKITEASFVDLPSLKQLYLSNNHITELQYGAFHRVPELRSLDLNKNRVQRVHPESFLQRSGSGLEELSLVENDLHHVIDLRSLLDALPRLIFLDLSYNNLETIPFGALHGHPTLERLHLDYNKISLIDREAFMAMPALRELRLKNNSLSEVHSGPFWNLPSLKGLDLSGNFFRKVLPQLLGNLPSLRRVDFSQNEINFVDQSSFLHTPELEHINLSHNALETLHPATFRPLLNLYDLDVSYNYLVEFVPNLPRGLEYVHLSNNRISSIPSQSDLDLPSLRMLDISNNEIHGIPSKSLKSLPQLRRLYLGKNAIQKIEDDSFSGLSKVEVLDLEGNKLVQISSNSLKEMQDLKDINLRNNRLDIIYQEMFRSNPSLRKLDISNNKLSELLPGFLEKNQNLEVMDASDNFLIQLPLEEMKRLKILDLTNNRLKELRPEIMNGLTSVEELRLANNFIQELKNGVFDNMQHLRNLYLNSNELEVIESNAFKSLPVLKSLKFSKNKLREIPNFAFNSLPSLQIAELQENQLKMIGNEAFHNVSHLLLLNLSRNHLHNLDDSGLRSVKSLEVLDVSNNQLSRVTRSNFEKMERLVELRMNDNNICVVQGTPFDDMPRLRVLSLRNNKMLSLSEQTIQKLRTNIAILDLDGNPLTCSCNLLWLQAWLQESGSLPGPRCVDGSLLQEMRISRQDCSLEERNADLVAPGCENELLTSQVLAPNPKNLTREHKNHVVPSPEESEYFYDEYIDYPDNGTSPHLVPGDTPTIYAAPKNKTKVDLPKEVTNSPSSSGFTFFGVPLPSLDLKSLLGNGRMDDKKFPVADRKSAIVNKPGRNGARAGGGLPNSPEVQTGGFIPLLPGSGGFKPIPDPRMQFPSTPIQKIDSTTTETYLIDKEDIVLTTTSVPHNISVKILEESISDAPSNVDLETVPNIDIPTEIPQTSSTTQHVILEVPTTTTEKSVTILTTTEIVTEIPKKVVGAPLSALLVPGGQQPEFRPAVGRSTITKVLSPHVPLLEAGEPLRQEGEVNLISSEVPPVEDTRWYFANYNKTDLEPYIGVTAGKTNKGTNKKVGYWVFITGVFVVFL